MPLCDGVTVEGYYTAPVEPYEGATFEIDRVLICEGVDCLPLYDYIDVVKIEEECINLVEETIIIEKAMDEHLDNCNRNT